MAQKSQESTKNEKDEKNGETRTSGGIAVSVVTVTNKTEA